MMRVEEWIRRFENAVCARDYGKARALFDFRVIGFGTQAVRANGMKQLEKLQWERTWPHTEGFHFNKKDFICNFDNTVIVIAMWESWSVRSHKLRVGRATIVLQHCAIINELLCIHSHFSLNPVPEFG